MDDRILDECNETELLLLAARQKLGRLRRGIAHDVLVGIVMGELTVTRDHLSGTSETRAELAKFIQDNIERARSQLPGCNGICTSYPCSEGRHALCFSGNH